MTLPGCLKKNECPPPVVVTEEVYVFPPDQYLRATREPKIDDYPRTNGGLARFALDSKGALKEANRDKAAGREYMEKKRAAENGAN